MTTATAQAFANIAFAICRLATLDWTNGKAGFRGKIVKKQRF